MLEIPKVCVQKCLFLYFFENVRKNIILILQIKDAHRQLKVFFFFKWAIIKGYFLHKKDCHYIFLLVGSLKITSTCSLEI